MKPALAEAAAIEAAAPRWLALARRALVALPWAGAAAAGAWQTWRLRVAVARARQLAAKARPYECRPAGVRSRVLVVGDSTAVGVGAGAAEHSLPGLLAEAFPRVQIVNVAVSGARIADALVQVEAAAARGERFDLALLLVGGNDVFRHTPWRRLKADTRALLAALKPLARRCVWLGSADIGAAPVFTPPLAWWLRRRTTRAATLFAHEARAAGVHFIDFADDALGTPFADDAATWFAADGVHPSAASYRHCFELLREQAALDELLAADACLPQPVVARVAAP
ncbi:hypothetical protein CLD22_23945 [Rubrivivax gelatinosus]|nr:hypothetical protein [Rubrivivax gelatinosus]